MKSMVVFFALCAVAYGAFAPHNLPAILLDARGRPLESAEIINARALHLQAKALEGHNGLALGYNAPLLAHSALGYAGHGLYKRSLGHAYAAPAAVSHQARVDVHTSPAVVAHAAVAPIAHAAVLPASHHGAVAKINHAAVAPIGYAAPYNYGYGYYNAAPLAHYW